MSIIPLLTPLYVPGAADSLQFTTFESSSMPRADLRPDSPDFGVQVAQVVAQISLFHKQLIRVKGTTSLLDSNGYWCRGNSTTLPMQRDLAHCYAHLGKHAKARELCDAVLAVLDRVFRERGRDQKTVDYYLDPVERLLATIASGEDAVKSHLSSIVEHNWQELKLVYK